MNGYSQKVKAYYNWCRKNFYDDTLDKESLEQYLMHLWRKGNLKQSPESFKSALRKVCAAGGSPDPFTPKLNLMIKAFSVDFPKPEVKFIKVEDLSKISMMTKRRNVKEWADVLELMFFSIWQNIRISTLLEIKFNDIFAKNGAIYLVFVKGHRGPVWTTLHPIAETIANKRMKESNGDPNSLLMGSLKELDLNRILAEMCVAAGVKIHTWHDLRHTGSQYMNDLGYSNELLQALGTWKVCNSMKTYIRERKGLIFSRETRLLHEKCRKQLSERLRKLRPKMKWFPVQDLGSNVFG
jgi:hypothetical protein